MNISTKQDIGLTQEKSITHFFVENQAWILLIVKENEFTSLSSHMQISLI